MSEKLLFTPHGDPFVTDQQLGANTKPDDEQVLSISADAAVRTVAMEGLAQFHPREIYPPSLPEAEASHRSGRAIPSEASAQTNKNEGHQAADERQDRESRHIVPPSLFIPIGPCDSSEAPFTIDSGKIDLGESTTSGMSLVCDTTHPTTILL